MEQTDVNHLTTMNLEVDGDASRQIESAGKWAKFIAIVVFCCCGFLLIVFAIAGTYLMRMLPGSLSPVFGEFSSLGPGVFFATIIIIIAVIVYIYYLLFNFGQKAPRGAVTDDSEMLNKGFQSLKLFFIVSTIIAILGLLISTYSLINL